MVRILMRARPPGERSTKAESKFKGGSVSGSTRGDLFILIGAGGPRVAPESHWISGQTLVGLGIWMLHAYVRLIVNF